jgi:hypothetical protein
MQCKSQFHDWLHLRLFKEWDYIRTSSMNYYKNKSNFKKWWEQRNKDKTKLAVFNRTNRWEILQKMTSKIHQLVRYKSKSK